MIVQHIALCMIAECWNFIMTCNHTACVAGESTYIKLILALEGFLHVFVVSVYVYSVLYYVFILRVIGECIWRNRPSI